MTQIPHDTVLTFDPKEIADYKWESVQNIDLRIQQCPTDFVNAFKSNRESMKEIVKQYI